MKQKPEIIPTIARMSAVISYHYGREIEKYYRYFLMVEVVTKLATEIYLINEHKISNLLPIEFDFMIKAEAKRLLKLNNSIHISDGVASNN